MKVSWGWGKVGEGNGTHIELPPLNMLPGIFTRNNHHQFRDLATDHPFVELGHDFLDVGFDLVVGRDEHRKAIFLDGCEVFRGVDSSLEALYHQSSLKSSS